MRVSANRNFAIGGSGTCVTALVRIFLTILMISTSLMDGMKDTYVECSAKLRFVQSLSFDTLSILPTSHGTITTTRKLITKTSQKQCRRLHRHFSIKSSKTRPEGAEGKCMHVCQNSLCSLRGTSSIGSSNSWVMTPGQLKLQAFRHSRSGSIQGDKGGLLLSLLAMMG